MRLEHSISTALISRSGSATELQNMTVKQWSWAVRLMARA
jgi:hypothetical protein